MHVQVLFVTDLFQFRTQGCNSPTFSHVRDLSSMLTSAVEDPTAASGKIFNCVSDRAVTLDGMAKLCAQAAGRSVKIVHYNPKDVGVDAKKAFPFRNMVFYFNHLTINCKGNLVTATIYEP